VIDVIIILSVHFAVEDKSDDKKDSFYEELQHVFEQFPTYHVKILLGFIVKVGREVIFQLIVGNGSLHEISKDNRVRVVYFTMSKMYLSKV
jgi:hypothetical protein